MPCCWRLLPSRRAACGKPRSTCRRRWLLTPPVAAGRKSLSRMRNTRCVFLFGKRRPPGWPKGKNNRADGKENLKIKGGSSLHLEKKYPEKENAPERA